MDVCAFTDHENELAPLREAWRKCSTIVVAAVHVKDNSEDSEAETETIVKSLNQDARTKWR